MKLQRIKLASWMTIKQLIRHRLTVLMVFLIPAIFFSIILFTTKDETVFFKLVSVGEDFTVEVSFLHEALVFMAITAVGLITSFLALNLIQKDIQAKRRLVLCGYTTNEIIISKLIVLMLIIVVIGFYIASIMPFVFEPESFWLTALGFMLTGLVYSCYGILIGAVVRRELEGIFFVILLINIDAGWLQNPLFYENAENDFFIRYLPAFHPSQASMIGAFTEESMVTPILGSLAYAGILLVIAIVIFRFRMKINKNRR